MGWIGADRATAFWFVFMGSGPGAARCPGMTEEQDMPNLPRVAVIGTGGTISSLGNGSLDVLDYPDFGQKLTSEGLLDRFPETRLVAEPVAITYKQVGSTALGPEDWLELRRMIHQIARDDPAIAGFVI